MALQRYQHTAAEGNPAHGRHHLFGADLKTVEDIDETDTLHFISKLAERTLRTGHGVPRSDKASPKRPMSSIAASSSKTSRRGHYA